METDLSVVDELARQAGAKVAWERSMDFVIAYLLEMKRPLPAVAAQGLEIAKQFRAGQTGLEKLEEARVDCWKYLDERAASTDIATPIHCCIGAVICMLYDGSQQCEDSYDIVAFFLESINRFEDYCDLVGPLLRKYFVGNDSETGAIQAS